MGNVSLIFAGFDIQISCEARILSGRTMEFERRRARREHADPAPFTLMSFLYMVQSYVSIAEWEIQFGQYGLTALANNDPEKHDRCRGSAKYEQ
jgi:hypothetical protein